MIRLISAFFVVMFLLFLGCNTISDEILGQGNTTPPDSLGYSTVTIAGFELQYRIENDELHCILSAETTGWIAVGFDPSVMMKDANFIIGYVDDRSVQIRDDWGTNNTQHAADIDLGGTSDVSLIQGTEAEGVTEIEFKIPLDSGDQYDRVLAAGNSYPILLAKGNQDNFTGIHSLYAATEIELVQEGDD